MTWKIGYGLGNPSSLNGNWIFYEMCTSEGVCLSLYKIFIFSSCTYGVQWAYGIPLCLSVYLSIYPSTIRKNASSQICLDRYSWYFDIMIIRWGDNRGVQEFGVKGHLGVIWSRCSNMLKTLHRLHDSIDFIETWVKRSLARGSFGVFRKFWSEAVLGSLGVAFDHWVFNLLKTATKELG